MTETMIASPDEPDGVEASLLDQLMQERHFRSQELEWYVSKIAATAEALDHLAEVASGKGNSQVAWAWSNAARLVRRINEGPALDAMGVPK